MTRERDREAGEADGHQRKQLVPVVLDVPVPERESRDEELRAPEDGDTPDDRQEVGRDGLPEDATRLGQPEHTDSPASPIRKFTTRLSTTT
jgi:hypothetical protein